jgi:Flp pilus assembly protein TadD
MVAACASAPPPVRTLNPPVGTTADAARAVEEGNRLFAAGQFESAKGQYEMAVNAQPSLAEAHYDLALAMEKLGNQQAAYKHYIEAADLAPGNKVIWNAPPLRRYGLMDERKLKDKSYLDAKPQ